MSTATDHLLPNVPGTPRESVQHSNHDDGTSPSREKVLLQGWPTSPKPIQSFVGSTIIQLGVDLFLLAFSLAFLAFGIVVASYDQASTELHPTVTSALLQASKYGPSVFPILFACVVGRATHVILIWRLEQGARVGTLDLLAGSTSFTSTIMSQLQIQVLSFLGLALISIWTMSPIGGQASIRQLTVGSKNAVRPASFTYMVPSGDLTGYEGVDRGNAFAIVDTLLVSSVIAPPATKLSTLDTWGNVKIPMIEHYEGASTPDNEGWYNTQPSRNVYSSLVGIPMSGINESLLYHVPNVQTQYLRLECPVINAKEPSNRPQDEQIGFTGYIWANSNDTLRSGRDPATLAPFNFSFYSFGLTGYSQCLMTTTYVEAEIACNISSTCSVDRFRRSQLTHPQAGYTLMDKHSGSNSGWFLFSSGFINSISVGAPAYPTVIDNYLIAPMDSVNGAQQPDGIVSAPGAKKTLPTKGEYEARLGQLFNTYFSSMNALYAITNGMTPDTARMDGTSASTSQNYWLAGSATTNGTKTATVQVVQCHVGWVVALSIASIIMIIASVIPPIIRHFFTKAPDIRLNISSLAIRNNQYIAVPSSGTYLGAPDRARLLKNMKVQLGDVEPGRDVGRLEIGSIDPLGLNQIGELRNGRIYE